MDWSIGVYLDPPMPLTGIYLGICIIDVVYKFNVVFCKVVCGNNYSKVVPRYGCYPDDKSTESSEFPSWPQLA